MALAFTQLAFDSLDRANANPAGGNWTTVPGLAACQILNHGLQATTLLNTCEVSYNAVDFTLVPDQWAEIQVTHLSQDDTVFVSIRCNADDSNDYSLSVRLTAGNIFTAKLERYAGGSVDATLYNATIAFTFGDTLRIAALGTSIFIYHNGAAIAGPFTDATYATGIICLTPYAFTVPNGVIINGFSAGSVATDAAIPVYASVAVGISSKLNPVALAAASDVIFTFQSKPDGRDFSAAFQVVGTVSTLTASLQVSMDGGTTWATLVAAADFLSAATRAVVVNALASGALYKIHATTLTGAQDFWVCPN